MPSATSHAQNMSASPQFAGMKRQTGNSDTDARMTSDEELLFFREVRVICTC